MSDLFNFAIMLDQQSTCTTMKRFSNICQFFRCWKPVSQKLTLILLLVYHALTVLRRACAAQSKTANQIESNNKSIRILWMASKIKSKHFLSEKVSKFLRDAMFHWLYYHVVKFHIQMMSFHDSNQCFNVTDFSSGL